MKTVELTKATRPLGDYAAEVSAGPLLVTRRGKPLAALVSMEGIDPESLAVSVNPEFVSIIQQARASRAKGTIPAAEMRRRLGVRGTRR
jgi:prevent-host-death family protein